MTPGLRGFPAVGGGHASGLHASFQAWRSEAPRMSCVTGVAVTLMRKDTPGWAPNAVRCGAGHWEDNPVIGGLGPAAA